MGEAADLSGRYFQALTDGDVDAEEGVYRGTHGGALDLASFMQQLRG